MLTKNLYNNIVKNCSSITHELSGLSMSELYALNIIIEDTYKLKIINNGEPLYEKEYLNLTEEINKNIDICGFYKDEKLLFFEDFCVNDIIDPEKIVKPLTLENIKTYKNIPELIMTLIKCHNRFNDEEASQLADFRTSFKRYYAELYAIAINQNNFTTRTIDRNTISDKYFDLSKLDKLWTKLLLPLKIYTYLPLGKNTFSDRKILIKNVEDIITFSRNNKNISKLILI